MEQVTITTAKHSKQNVWKQYYVATVPSMILPQDIIFPAVIHSEAGLSVIMPNTFTDEHSLRNAIADYMTFYITERRQERFKGKTPAEVRAEALATDTPAQYPIPENRRIQKYKARYAA